MLIYFSANNFRSIDEPIELNMKAAPRLRRHKNHARTPTKDKKKKVLKGALLYGANASGKSNVIKAMSYAKEVITGESNLDYCPFLRSSHFSLVKDGSKKRDFTFEFCIRGEYYAYFFSVENNIIAEEELVHITQNSEKKIYHREIDKSKSANTVVYSYTSDVENISNDSEFLVFSKYTSPKKLFLTDSSEKIRDFFRELELSEKKFNSEVDISFLEFLLPAFLFFNFHLIIIFPESKYSSTLSDLSSGNGNCFDVIKSFDTGIEKLNSTEVPLNKFTTEQLEEIKSKISSNNKPYSFDLNEVDYLAEFIDETSSLKITKLTSIHKSKSGEEIIFDFEDESDGTKRIVDLLPTLSNDKKFPLTFVIDEFDRSLHPLLSIKLLRLFLETDSDDQLITTTHEAELLDNEILRRDVIWFFQKERDGSTQLYSLSDYSPRYDKDIHSAYLKGVFGGVPNLSGQ